MNESQSCTVRTVRQKHCAAAAPTAAALSGYAVSIQHTSGPRSFARGARVRVGRIHQRARAALPHDCGRSSWCGSGRAKANRRRRLYNDRLGRGGAIRALRSVVGTTLPVGSRNERAAEAAATIKRRRAAARAETHGRASPIDLRQRTIGARREGAVKRLEQRAETQTHQCGCARQRRG